MKYANPSILAIGIIFLISTVSFSQDDVTENYHLTHKLSSKEKELMNSFNKDFFETDPPVGEVRNIAEWEPMEAVLVAYDGGFGVPLSLIAEMSEDCNVTTIVSGSSEESSVRNIYTSNGVNLDHCNFVYQDPDSWWTRDYSPWYIAIDDNETAIVNFPYNRPRPNDNDVPILMADSLNIDLYGMNIEHTGGNYMCDGYGIAASTDLVWEENTNQSHSEINTKMLNYLGIEAYHVTPDPLDDYIKHIDCWAKFLDVDKLLLTQVPVSDYRYDDYEALADYFSTQNCSWGYPYEVIRVQAADYNEYEVNPYTNSLILNHKVFVPQTGSYLDDEAIATYEAAMPGYEVIGVYSSSWINSDALHCRTHGIADREMLYIEHYPLHDDQVFQSSFTIEADVVSYGGSPVSSGFPKLFFNMNNTVWEETLMTNTGGNTYTASIPGLAGYNEVQYYIYAENNNNKQESHPGIGSADPHTFFYSAENALLITNSVICIGNSTGDITLTDYIGTITDWEKRLNGASWESIGYTGEIYSEIPAETGTWEYRVELNNGSFYSSIASIIVSPLTEGGQVNGGSTICENESTGTLTLANYTGDILKWQRQLDGAGWQDILNNEDTYSEIPEEDGTWTYRALVKSGECSEVYSESTNVIVNPSASAGFTYTTDNSTVSFTNTSESADGFLWDFGDGNSSSDENPVHTYSVDGTYNVVLTASNGICPDDLINEDIIISTLDLDEISSRIQIIPNPSNGKFTLQIPTGTAKLYIFNLNGQAVFSSGLYSERNTIDISNLKVGIYLIKISVADEIYYEKLIIK